MAGTLPGTHLTPTDVLYGRKVHLRLPRYSELPFIRTMWGDPETMEPVGGPVDFPEARANDWFARMIQPGDPADCYCLIVNEAGAPIGEVSFHHWNPRQRSAELSIKVLAARRGHGYAKDALDAFLEFFFVRVGGELLTDDVAGTNRAGQQLLTSRGFAGDHSVQGICRMRMTKQTYVSSHREPNRPTSAILKSRVSAFFLRSRVFPCLLSRGRFQVWFAGGLIDRSTATLR
jgi:RimJ/RimL family protein N-acetyltransferase